MLWVPLIVGLALVIITLQSRIRSEHPEWGVLISAVFAVVILFGLIPRLQEVVMVFSNMASQTNVGTMYLAPVLKTIAVAYVTSFGAHISRDAGEEAIAAVVELAGKVVIILVALPILQAILQSLLGILS